MTGPSSEAVQEVRVAMVLELGNETRRRDVARTRNRMIDQHHSQGRIDGIAWSLQVLGFLGQVDAGE